MRPTAPTITATLSTGLVLKVLSAELSLDDTRAPYASATLTIAEPATTAQLDSIDPRAPGGRRVAITVSDRADLFGRAATSRSFDLLLHDRQWGASSGELVLQCYSDEQLLIDGVLLLANVRDWGQISTRSLTAAVLASLGFALAPGSTDVAIAATAAVQSPGQSYWDFLDGTLQGSNLRLWCDEARAWHLDDKGLIAPGLTSLAYDETLAGANEAIGLDANYYDSVVARFSYLDASGNAQTSYDYAAASSTPRRGTRVDFTGAPGVAGTARRLLRRMQGRGKVLTHDAVNRFDVTPTQSFLSTPAAGRTVQSGLVSGVTWRMPADRMDVRTRELTDTIGTSWAAMGAGSTWASIAAGVSWSQYLAVPWPAAPVGRGWAAIPAGYRWTEFDKYLKETA